MLARQVRWLGPLVFLLCFGAVAHANDFRTHYELGVALYQAQKFEEAIPEFKAAYDIDPRAGLLFNIAQAYRKAGHPRDAIQYYDRYLTSDPRIDTDTRRKIDGYLAEARNTLAALELELKQRLAEEKAARSQEPEPQPTVEAPPPVHAAPEPMAMPPPSLVLVEPRSEKTPIYRRWWFWGSIGVVVAAGVVGITVGVLQAQARSPVDPKLPKAVVVF